MEKIEVLKCKHSHNYNASKEFYQNGNGKWLYTVICRNFQYCQNREKCPGMTESLETPQEAVSAWNNLLLTL